MIIYITILAVLLGSAQATSQEHTIRKYGSNTHLVIKFFMVGIFSLLISMIQEFISGSNYLNMFYIEPTIYSFAYILLAVIIMLITYTIYNKMIENSVSIYLLKLIIKLVILITLCIEIFNNTITLNIFNVLGIIIFIVGYILLFTNKEEFKCKISNVGLILVPILLLLKVALPYIERYILVNDYTNITTLVAIQNISIAAVYFIIFGVRFKITKDMFKEYFFQSLFCAMSVVLFKVVLKESVVMYVISNSLVIIGIMLFSKVFLKKKISIKEYWIILCILIGYVMININ
jgi:hypothetical protein